MIRLDIFRFIFLKLRTMSYKSLKTLKPLLKINLATKSNAFVMIMTRANMITNISKASLPKKEFYMSYRPLIF